MRQLIIFDCDGTLVDSQANIILAMHDSFRRHDVPLPDPRLVRRIVGLSLLEAVQALLPEAALDLQQSLAQDYKQAFHRLRGAGLVDEPLYPGVRQVLETLAAAGHPLAVATGKSDRGLATVLAHHDLDGFFCSLQTADRHPSKPHPSMIYQAMADADARPENTVMIGDTVFDIAMAVNAGVRGIGVTWGYHDPHELVQAGAIGVVADFAELGPLMAWAA